MPFWRPPARNLPAGAKPRQNANQSQIGTTTTESRAMHIDNITLAEPARDWSWDSAAAARQWYHNARANRRLARERREARLAHPEVPEGKPLHEFNVRVVYDGGETSGRCAVIQRPGMLVEWKFKGKAPKGLPRAGKLRRVPTADAYERTVAAVIADGWRERGAVAEVSDRA